MKRTRICQTAGAFAVLAAAGLLTGCSKADTGAFGADNKLYTTGANILTKVLLTILKKKPASRWFMTYLKQMRKCTR